MTVFICQCLGSHDAISQKTKGRSQIIGASIDNINAALITAEVKSLLSDIDTHVLTRAATADIRFNFLDANITSRMATFTYTPPPSIAGLATTVQLTATEASIKGASNKDLTQVFTAIDLTPITSKLPSAGAKIAGEGVIAKNLDQVTAGLTPAQQAQLSAVEAKTNQLNFTNQKVDANYFISEADCDCTDNIVTVVIDSGLC